MLVQDAPVASKSLPLIPGFDLESFMKFSVEPSDTQAILDVQKSMLTAPRRPEMIAAVVKAVETSEPFVRLFNERYIPDFPTTEQLLAFGAGTLGRAVGEHLHANGIQLDFAGLDLSMFYRKEMNLLTYLSVRGIRIHDILHAVLGLGVSPLEEYALANFTLAQYRSPYHMMIVASGYLSTAFQRPDEIEKFLDVTHRYYQLGATSKFITAYKFEDNFATPLSQVRRELDLPEIMPIVSG